MRDKDPSHHSTFVDEKPFKSILDSQASSYWLKEIVRSGSERDPVDVIHDLRSALSAFEGAFDFRYSAPAKQTTSYETPVIVPLSITIFVASLVVLAAALNHERYEPSIGYFALAATVMFLASVGWAYYDYRKKRA